MEAWPLVSPRRCYAQGTLSPVDAPVMIMSSWAQVSEPLRPGSCSECQAVGGRERSRKPPPSALSGLVVSCREPLCEIPPMTWSWRKYQAGKAVQDPIHDEGMRKNPDRQGHRGHKGPSRLASASTPPCILPPFLLLFLFAPVWILFHWIKTNLKC